MEESERNGKLSLVVSPASPMLFGLTFPPFLAGSASINGHRLPGTATRRLMGSLLIGKLGAGIDLIELRHSKADHSVQTVSTSNF